MRMMEKRVKAVMETVAVEGKVEETTAEETAAVEEMAVVEDR